MLEQLLDHRERQQIRKDRIQKRNLRYLTGFFFVLLILALIVGVVDDAKPAKKTTAVSTVNQKEMQDIEKFSYVVTKPLGELSDEDFKLVEAKAEDPCYADNTKLPRTEMIEVIAKCKGVK